MVSTATASSGTPTAATTTDHPHGTENLPHALAGEEATGQKDARKGSEFTKTFTRSADALLRTGDLPQNFDPSHLVWIDLVVLIFSRLLQLRSRPPTQVHLPPPR